MKSNLKMREMMKKISECFVRGSIENKVILPNKNKFNKKMSHNFKLSLCQLNKTHVLFHC
jgi:hypothetical protein